MWRRIGWRPMREPTFDGKITDICLTSNYYALLQSEDSANVEDFIHYEVTIHDIDDDHLALNTPTREKIISALKAKCAIEFGNTHFIYDGHNSLFTSRALPGHRLDFEVLVDDKSLKVSVKWACLIPIKQAITEDNLNLKATISQDGIKALNMILQEHAEKSSCLVVGQAVFPVNDATSLFDIGEGLMACCGFQAIVQQIYAGVCLNTDVAMTVVVNHDSVFDFLKSNQNVDNLQSIDWSKAGNVLKNLRIKIVTSEHQEYRIMGLSSKPCTDQVVKLGQLDGKGDRIETTVYNYFVHHKKIPLLESDFPCINVGNPEKPVYFPIELCSLIPLQRYTNALSPKQRKSLMEYSEHITPRSFKDQIKNARIGFCELQHCADVSGISIKVENCIRLEGRLLEAPEVTAGLVKVKDEVKNGERFRKNTDSSWNLYNERFYEPSTNLYPWAVVNFSTLADVKFIFERLMKVADQRGMFLHPNHWVIRESEDDSALPPTSRVEKIMEKLSSESLLTPQFILCLLPKRKNCALYGPWKKICLTFKGVGIPTQCIAPGNARINDRYFNNLLLKINAKVGGMNFLLPFEHSWTHDVPRHPPGHPGNPVEVPTLFLGMTIRHGPPQGRPDIPSIAAVVGSIWPQISRYAARVRTQSSNISWIDHLFEPSGVLDRGIIKEFVEIFCKSCPGRKYPEYIIIFRDEVSEAHFPDLLDKELEKMKEACRFFDKNWDPKFIFIVAQRTHRSKFFVTGAVKNVTGGTVIDNGFCRPTKGFYLYSKDSRVGITRPTHYQVLYSDVELPPDVLPQIVHNLSFISQRCTTAINIAVPLRYARLTMKQMSQWPINPGDIPETSSSERDTGNTSLVLGRKLSNSMFFC